MSPTILSLEPPPILETALYVTDLERSIRFYHETFGFEAIARDERFCALNAGNVSVLLLFQKGASTEKIELDSDFIPPHDARGEQHIAFRIEPGQWDDWIRRLEEMEVTVESRVRWDGGARSLFFRDPDSHLLELATPGVWGNL